MIKKNDILSSDFIDFKIFACADGKNASEQPSITGNGNTLIVMYATENEESNLSFLSKILSAVKLDLSKDVSLIKATPKDRLSFISLKTNSTIEKVILFGIQPKHLGINIDLKAYTPTAFQDCVFLLTHDLGAIESDTNKKKALWSCLQEIYLK